MSWHNVGSEWNFPCCKSTRMQWADCDQWNFPHCRVLQCDELMVTCGACNPYAVVALHRGQGSKHKDDARRTPVKKKTVKPSFNEVFLFEVKFQFEIFYEINDTKNNGNALCFKLCFEGKGRCWVCIVNYIYIYACIFFLIQLDKKHESHEQMPDYSNFEIR